MLNVSAAFHFHSDPYEQVLVQRRIHRACTIPHYWNVMAYDAGFNLHNVMFTYFLNPPKHDIHHETYRCGRTPMHMWA